MDVHLATHFARIASPPHCLPIKSAARPHTFAPPVHEPRPTFFLSRISEEPQLCNSIVVRLNDTKVLRFHCLFAITNRT